MNTVEALKMAIRFAQMNNNKGMYKEPNNDVVIYGDEIVELLKSALSELEQVQHNNENVILENSKPVGWIIQTEKIDGTLTEPYAILGKLKYAKDVCDFGNPIPLFTSPPKHEWISVKDRLPKYLEGKEYSANVLGLCKGYKDIYYISIFNVCIVDYTEDGHQYAWARLSQCFGDLRDADCEWDDDYEVTHWQPLPEPPKD